ncbi:hypothetical protein AGDE_09113 [Angomonas deanei]|uniref:Uncharacterized protein n=1 Tax=Angomonas deanei TaxID=59799 RepID=A0A7G2C7K5_9TRYP|nr:hypothetical protein AGDE_09113 [Angomonas deanei]CAD2215084.1 hypothetical protein, conserved [Angomonas deanei]|eukprot:EPY31316.1 hypothetical protein AGDE_09113 [Angomonas deanei]
MADRVIAYGERMRNFDRSKYKSQWRRIWEFCFYDHWSRFWEDLPKRLTLATPRDVRIVKDAIKMACAYGVGVMFTQYMDPEHAYYFGMAILMGVGWPTAGDTMVASVYRITGMVCASAIAYVAVWHTNNLSGELAIALAGVFISLLFRDVMPYAHTAQYCSMLIITSLNSAGTKLVLLSRIVSNAFTVMAYYVICVFMFPIDVLKVTYSYQMKSCLFITGQFTQLVRIMNVPLNCADPERREALMAELRVLDRSRREGFQIIATFGMWMHKAIMEPTARGLPYPLQEMKSVYSSLRRLSSATDMMFVALFQLYTPRANPVDESIATQIRLITPVMRKIDVKMRVVMQDFIDAMATPLQWTPEGATRHFSDFLALSKDLHDVFNTQSRRSIEALREEFRNSVMNRTFARAAQSNIIPTPPITGNNFAVPFSQNNSFFPPGRNTSFIPANTSFAKVSTDGVATTLQGKDLEEALDPIERAAEEEAYTDFIGARPTAVDDDASTTTHPLSTNDTAVPIGDAPLQTQVSFVDSDPRGGVSFVGIPPVRFSVENDMEMVLSIIVASEIFFGEAERLLRTMYNINLYARSRDGPPKLESPFEV